MDCVVVGTGINSAGRPWIAGAIGQINSAGRPWIARAIGQINSAERPWITGAIGQINSAERPWITGAIGQINSAERPWITGAIGQLNKMSFNKSRRCQGRCCKSCVLQRGLLSKRRPRGRDRQRQWRRS